LSRSKRGRRVNDAQQALPLDAPPDHATPVHDPDLLATGGDGSSRVTMSASDRTLAASSMSCCPGEQWKMAEHAIRDAAVDPACHALGPASRSLSALGSQELQDAAILPRVTLGVWHELRPLLERIKNETLGQGGP
jgi:hypothetical protein